MRWRWAQKTIQSSDCKDDQRTQEKNGWTEQEVRIILAKRTYKEQQNRNEEYNWKEKYTRRN